MSERDQDEPLLIDYVLGRCAPAAAERVRQRLESDEPFAALHRDVANSLAALGAWAVADPPADLVDRTLARVRAARRTEALLETAPIEPEPRRSAFSFRELAALAAAVIVAVGILIPSLLKAHQQAQRTLCADNVRAIFTGMSHYASVNGEALPSSPVRDGSWLSKAGARPASNSAGLFLLVRNHYADPEVFRCPAAGGAGFVLREGMIDFPSPRSVGYSYQYSLKGPIRRDDPELQPVAHETPILADANPVFPDGHFRADRVDRRVSENHGDTGQNVLRLDGSVFWAADANVGFNDDNIWLIQGIVNYTGMEEPVSKLDTFLAPNRSR